MKNNKRAYTLAEVLIVVAIIGVIAMLTVPSAIKNYRSKIYAAQIKKLHALLSAAVQSSLSDEHLTKFYESKSGLANVCSATDPTDCSQGPGYFLNTYVASVNKNCKTGTNSCIASSYSTISGNAVAAFSADYCTQLKTGEAVCMEYNATDKKTHIYVDINSKQAPNIAGRDLFYMTINEDGSIGDYKGTAAANCSTTDAAGCLNKLVDASWKLDY